MAEPCACISCEGASCRYCATCHERCSERLSNERFPVGRQGEFLLTEQQVVDVLARYVAEREGIRGRILPTVTFEFARDRVHAVRVVIRRTA